MDRSSWDRQSFALWSVNFRMNLWSNHFSQIRTKIVKISALTTQGRNPDNFLFVFWEKRWPHEFILKLSVNFKRTLLSHHFDQKTNTFFLRISALASVKSSNQKSINLRYITVGRLDDDMIVPPSDGAMFILINWE